MTDIFRICVKNILRNKLRSTLTMIGIAIGSFSVIIITAIGDVGKHTVNSELDSIGLGGLAVTVDQRSSVKISDNEIATVSSTANIKHAIPLMCELTNSRILDSSAQCFAWGVNNQANKIIDLEVLYGRMINQSDIISGAKYCVIDENMAREYYKRSNIVGKKINLLLKGSYQEFEVIGVVASGGNVLQGLMGGFVPYFVYLPYTTMRHYTGRSNYDQIMIRLNEGADSDSVAETITSELEKATGGKGSIYVENLVAQKDSLNTILSAISIVLTAIAAISLVVAGLSIMTVMLVSVHERTREIGIKKSIGASKHKIMLEFLTESFLISLTGAVIGITSAISLTALSSMLFEFPFPSNPGMIGFCLIFAVILSIIFGVYPAGKAAGLKPVDALRM